MPSSIKHEYNGKWKERNTRLSTCDPITKVMVMNSDGPQMVEEGKEIIFTYDIEFQVCVDSQLELHDSILYPNILRFLVVSRA